MTIQVYDSLTRQLRPLEPLEPGLVRLYVCGPTVYSDCHIGHLMGPVLFDSMARWLQARGLEVRFVNNITDIDDKIIVRAREEGVDWTEIARRYEEQYRDFLRELAVTTVTDHPRCTETVTQMVAFVERMIGLDRAYVAGDGVYYEVEKQPNYGKLSGRRLEDTRTGTRVGVADGLRNPADFALWKFAKPGEPSWESPWGAGRPGWHLECSVMARDLLGEHFDLHGGGDDLKFPHHENEIAQSEAYGDRFAKCWMHHGLAQYEGRKIAKSDPRMRDPEFSRQFNARWLIDTYGAPAIRFFLLRGHYRRPIDFEPSSVEGARTGLMRMFEKIGPSAAEAPLDAASPSEQLQRLMQQPLPDSGQDLQRHRDRFVAAMDDDFNTGAAVAELFALQNAAQQLDVADRQGVFDLLCGFGRLLGMFQPGDYDTLRAAGKMANAADAGPLEAVVGVVATLRGAARAAKDFATADALRDGLQAAGVTIRDASGDDGAAGSFEFLADELTPAARLEQLLTLLIETRRSAREARDFARADQVRDLLGEAGVQLTDGADGTSWELS